VHHEGADFPWLFCFWREEETAKKSVKVGNAVITNQSDPKSSPADDAGGENQ